METETKTDKPLLEKVADQLLIAQRELDELALQLSLGKAEAKTKYEEIKHEFRTRVAEFKALMEGMPKQVSPAMKRKLEELDLQLALGKAETKDAFETQRKKIQKAISALEAEFSQWLKTNSSSTFGHEIEKFKLKLEIIRLKFGLKKFEIKDEFRDLMSTAQREIHKLTDAPKSTLRKGKEKYTNVSNEISLAYKHLKKAVGRLSE